MASGQARFTKRYSDAEKDALMRAVLVDGVIVAEAVRRAPQGRLGVPAFHLDLQYAYQLVKNGRERFESANPDALRGAIDQHLIKLAAKALKQARALEAQDVADPDQIRVAIRSLKEAKTGLQAPAKAPMSPRPVQEPDVDEKPSEDVLGRLLGNGKGPH